MEKIGSVLSILVVCTLAVFVVQNLGSVEIHFLGWTLSVSVAVPVLAAYLFGGVTGRPLWRLSRGQRKARKTRLKAEKVAAQKLEEQSQKAAKVPGDEKS